MATGGYFETMKHVPIKLAKDQFTRLAREAEAGEQIVITRNGRPIAELGPVQKRGGLNWEALEQWKRDLGVDKLVTYIADNFDDPFPEDFLITPER